MGLAYEFANRQVKIYKVDYHDALSDAQLALVNAARSYDPEKSRFSTFYFRCAINQRRKANIDNKRLCRGGDGDGGMKHVEESLHNSRGKIRGDVDLSKEEPDLCEVREIRDTITEVLGTLPVKDAEILRINFGIGCEAKNLVEIAGIYGVSRQRIFEIKERSLEKLKYRLLGN